jgi:hypothetical protein
LIELEAELVDPGETSAKILDPISDPRWMSLVQDHPSSSIFHTPEWLRALQLSFGYEPVVVTTAGPEEKLTDGALLCIIRSRLTGTRIVSLPFSDHCEILGANDDNIHELVNLLTRRFFTGRVRYIELRPVSTAPALQRGFCPSDRFLHHTLDLSPSLGSIFQSLHRDSVQRRIRRATNAGLAYEKGNSECLLRVFYELHIETRRRLGLPPFPFKWFRSLAANLKHRMQIRVAFFGKKPIASLLTLEFKKCVTYKYGASEAHYHRFGGMPFLFWRTIEEAKSAGMLEFDFGRSEPTSSGLLQFKRRWGVRESALTYWQIGNDKYGYERSYRHKTLAQQVFVHTPRPILLMLAQLYRHLG